MGIGNRVGDGNGGCGCRNLWAVGQVGKGARNSAGVFCFENLETSMRNSEVAKAASDGGRLDVPGIFRNEVFGFQLCVSGVGSVHC